MPGVVRDQDTVNSGPPVPINAVRQAFVRIFDLGDAPRAVVVGAAGANLGDPVTAHDSGIHIAATMAAPIFITRLIQPLGGPPQPICSLGDAATCAHVANTASTFVTTL